MLWAAKVNTNNIRIFFISLFLYALYFLDHNHSHQVSSILMASSIKREKFLYTEVLTSDNSLEEHR